MNRRLYEAVWNKYDALTPAQKELLKSKTDFLDAYLGRLTVAIQRVENGRKPGKLPK